MRPKDQHAITRHSLEIATLYLLAISPSTCSRTRSSHSYHMTLAYQSSLTPQSARSLSCRPSGPSARQPISPSAHRSNHHHSITLINPTSPFLALPRAQLDSPRHASFPGARILYPLSTPSGVYPSRRAAAWLLSFRVVVVHWHRRYPIPPRDTGSRMRCITSPAACVSTCVR